MNISDHAIGAADSPALIAVDGGTVPYGELYERSQRVAAVLHEAGLRRGDGVVLVLPNRREFFEITWGCQLSGLYYSAVNTHFTPDEIACVIDDGGELPVGESGELFFEGGPDFEHFKDPGKTASVSNELGWRSLGDMGYLDEDGYVYLTDRSTFTIDSGGVNIYPQEVENLLVMHPKLVDAAVFGVPNDEFGEEVKAVVQSVDGVAAGPELEVELIEYCRAHLAAYKCPRTAQSICVRARTSASKPARRSVD